VAPECQRRQVARRTFNIEICAALVDQAAERKIAAVLVNRAVIGERAGEVDPGFGTRGLIGKSAVPLLNGADHDEANETDD